MIPRMMSMMMQPTSPSTQQIKSKIAPTKPGPYRTMKIKILKIRVRIGGPSIKSKSHFI